MLPAGWASPKASPKASPTRRSPQARPKTQTPLFPAGISPVAASLSRPQTVGSSPSNAGGLTPKLRRPIAHDSGRRPHTQDSVRCPGLLAGLPGSAAHSPRRPHTQGAILPVEAPPIGNFIPSPLSLKRPRTSGDEVTELTAKPMKCWPGLSKALAEAAPPRQDVLVTNPPRIAENTLSVFGENSYLQDDDESFSPSLGTIRDLRVLQPPCSPRNPDSVGNSILPGTPRGAPTALEPMMQNVQDNAASNQKGAQGFLSFLQNPLPPLKSWLKKELSKVRLGNNINSMSDGQHTQSTSTLRSLNSTKTAQTGQLSMGSTALTERALKAHNCHSDDAAVRAEVANAQVQRSQYHGAVFFRGDLSERLDEADLEKLERSKHCFQAEHGRRQAQRREARKARELQKEQKERHDQIEQRRKAAEEHTKLREAKEVDKAKSKEKQDETTPEKKQERTSETGMSWIKMLRPQQALSTRLNMLDRLRQAKAKATKDQLEEERLQQQQYWDSQRDAIPEESESSEDGEDSSEQEEPGEGEQDDVSMPISSVAFAKARKGDQIKATAETNKKLLQVPEKKKSKKWSKTMTWAVIRSAVVGPNDKPGPQKRPKPTISASEMVSLKEAFNRYDVDQSCSLDMKEARQAFADVGICPKSKEEKKSCADILKESMLEAGEDGIDFDDFVILVHRLREKISELQRAVLEELYEESCDRHGVFNMADLKKILQQLGHEHGVHDREMREVEKEFANFQPGRKYAGSENKNQKQTSHGPRGSVHMILDDFVMQDFPQFEVCLRKAQERLTVLLRERERQIQQKRQVNDKTFEEFRSDFLQLDDLFTKYDADNSGELDEDEVNHVLTDFGVMPKSRLERQAMVDLFWEVKHPGKSAPADFAQRNSVLNGAGRPAVVASMKLEPRKKEVKPPREALNFSFSEFLLLMKKVRKLQADSQMSDLKTEFNRYDRDKSGELDMREISMLLSDIGLQPRTRQEQAELIALLDEADEDGSNSFTFDEFQALVVRAREKIEKVTREKEQQFAIEMGFTVQRYSELKEIFETSNESGSGMLGISELRTTLNTLKKRATSDELHELFFQYGKDFQGTLFMEMQSFLSMMKEVEIDKTLLTDKMDINVVKVEGAPGGANAEGFAKRGTMVPWAQGHDPH